MSKPIHRKEFLKISSLSALGLLLASCGFDTEKDKAEIKTDTSRQKSGPALLAKESEHVIYITKESEQYEALNVYFNKRIRKEPAIIALCKTTAGVSEAVSYAREHKLQIAVKSGGHSFEAFSNNTNGLVINLSLINSIELSEDNTVKVGPGAKLHQLYDVLLPQQRIVPAGSCAGVGIAGLTLGGGYGFFSRKYGLTCDSLTEVELVDGKGIIRSSASDEQLLWACRGGGNGNFGVVTKFIFKTYEAPATFQSHRFKAFNLDAERATALLQKWFEVTATLPTACFGAYVLNGKTLTILITNYEEHTDALQAALDKLSPLCDKTSTGLPVPIEKALKPFYGVQTPIYFKNASAGLYKDYNAIKDCIRDVTEQVIASQGLIYQVNTLGGKITDADLEKESCYAHRAYPYLSELQAYWEKPEREAALVEKFEEIQKLFRKNGIKAQYINYPDLGFENWEEAYYGENYKKLQEIKKTYDPENNFRHEQSIRI